VERVGIVQTPVNIQHQAIQFITSQDTLHAVLDALPDAILLLNHELIVLFANRALLRLTRLPAEVVVGSYSLTVLRALDEQLHGDHGLASLLFHPQVNTDAAIGTILRLADDRVLEATIEPSILGRIVLIRDVSDQWRAMQALYQRATEAEILREAGTSISATLDSQEAMQRIIEQMARVVPHDSASVQLRHDDRTKLIGCRGFSDAQKIIGRDLPINGNPLHETIYYHAQPVCIGETMGASGFFGVPDYPIRSWLGIPLVFRGEVIGMLTLDSATPHHFTPDHVRMGLTFATEVAVVLEHIRLYQQALSARERLTILHQAIPEITALSLIPEQVYRAIHTTVHRLMAADAFVISLLRPESAKVEHVYMADSGGTWPQRQSDWEGSFAAYLVQRGTSLRYGDVAEVQGYEFARFGALRMTRSGLAVLLRGSSGPLGLLFTQSYSSAAYSVEDQELLELLAAHVATALESATRFADLDRLATTDALTGLANRRHFMNVASAETARSQRYRHPLSLILFDIDDFKALNDRYGHLVGDEVLRAVAATCHTWLRSSDTLARYGGEELIALLPETEASGALHTAERLRRAIERLHIPAADAELQVSASFGVTTHKGDSPCDLDELIRRADQAMYAAKRAGKNRVVVWEPYFET
jgi:diguanylate cyclase (GGDEF)-like protein